ncbi:glycosyltransferase [Flavobacteriaceae bacterium]|nr:glycosyltransferase [Flavobacteriaceae bacterium]
MIKIFYSSLVDFNKNNGPSVNEKTFINYFRNNKKHKLITFINIDIKEKNIISYKLNQINSNSQILNWVYVRFFNLIKMIKILYKEKPDYIVIRPAPLIFFQLLPLFFFKQPLYLKTSGFFAFDGFYKKSMIRYLIYPINYFINKLMINRSLFVEVTGNDMKTIITKRYAVNSNKIVIVENGFDDTLFNTKNEIQYNINNKFTVTYCGNFPSKRGGFFLIDLVSKAKSRGINILGNIVGGGIDEINKCKEYAILNNVDNQINLQTEISFKKIPEILSNSNIGISMTMGSEVIACEQKVRQYFASGMHVISNTIGNKTHLEKTQGLYSDDLDKAIVFLENIKLMSNENYNIERMKIKQYAETFLSNTLIMNKRLKLLKNGKIR